jgi:NCS1 family nucleobase:cation symporter-1
MAIVLDRAPGANAAFAGDPALSNPDLDPTPVEQRTWSTWSYAALWMGMIHSAFGFSVLGGMIATGMSAWQALLVVAVANTIQLGLMALTGRVGARHGIPFAVWARSAFGPLGANVPALLRGFVAIGWFGVQCFLGATALNAMLGTVFDGWKGLDSVVFGVGINLWLSMLLYWALSYAVIHHGMETVRRFESWAGPLVLLVMIPMVIWAIDKGHGLGPVFDVKSKHASFGDFMGSPFFTGVALFISASWATMVLNLPDLTRFARSNRAQVRGTAIGLPLATIVFYGMATIIVSGTQAYTGKTLWNPADVLVAINIPALTIIGAVMIAIATLSVNVAANLVSPAYDITNFLPRVFNFKRAASLAIVLGFVYMPWKLMESPDTLFRVLNNVSAIIGPAAGVMIADYYLVRKRKLDIADLYRLDGRYRAYKGFNLVGLGALTLGTIPCLLGQVVDPIDWAYNYAFFVGIAIGFVAYPLLVRVTGRAEAPEFQPAGDEGVEADELAFAPAGA